MFSRAPSRKGPLLGPLAGDTVKYLPSVLATVLSGVVVLPLVTRLITPASFGEYSLAMGAATFLQAISVTWIGSTLVRYHTPSQDSREVVRLVATTFWLTVAFSLAVGAISIGVGVLYRIRSASDFGILILLLPLVIIPFNLLAVPLQMLRVERRIGAHNLLNIARMAVPPVLGTAAVLVLGREARYFMAGWGVGLAVLVPWGVAVAFRDRRALSLGSVSRLWARQLLIYGTPLIPAMMLVKVLELSGRFIIGYFRNPVEVALYSVASTVGAMPMELIILAIGSAASPLLNAVWEKSGRESAEQLLTQITRGFVIVSIPTVVGLSVLAKPVLLLFAPAVYSDGHRLVPLIASGSIALAFQWLAQRGMLLAGETGRILGCYTVAALLNIISNIIVIPRYGYLASGWTSMLSYVVLLILIIRGSRRHMSWRLPWPTFTRAAASAGIMTAAIWLLPSGYSPVQEVLVKVPFGVAVYVTALLVLGERVKAPQAPIEGSA